MRPGPRESPVVAWALVAAGLVACVYAWRIRQPLTTSDFSILYASARNPPAQMYMPLAGARLNMNPPQFQLALRPLTAFPLPIASAIFRLVNLVSFVACLWWLVRSSGQGWTAADVGAVLAWVPMAAVLSLNQLTWILWPLLLYAWAAWRRDRWTAGAIAFGVALSIKPFLAVIVLWLVVSGRWRPALTALVAGAAMFLLGAVAYGAGPLRDWIGALRQVEWSWAPMNASLEGWIARTTAGGPDAAGLPPLLRLVSLAVGLAIVLAALARTRDVDVERSWPLLVTTALLVSPLGWIYYFWWIFPGIRPWRVLLVAPLLWVPWAYLAVNPANRLVAATVGSLYFWGAAALWVYEMRRLSVANRPQQAAV